MPIYKHLSCNIGSDFYRFCISKNEATVFLKIDKNNLPLRGVTYQVDLATASDYTRIHGLDAVKELIAMAKEDLLAERWLPG